MEEDEMKDDIYTCFIETRTGNYKGEQKIGEHEELGVYISVRGNLNLSFFFKKRQ